MPAMGIERKTNSERPRASGFVHGTGGPRRRLFPAFLLLMFDASIARSGIPLSDQEGSC